MTFHHIGVATADIEKSIAIYQKMDYTWQSELVFTDTIQRVKLAFLEKKGMPLVELVAPIDETSPIHKILQKNGTIPYHTCYEVDNIEESIKHLKTLRFVPTTKPVPAIAFDNRLICFLYQPHFGIVELLQR
jgi:methylmalonyl-CoA/ethylmalonyl-CoA epimerase